MLRRAKAGRRRWLIFGLGAALALFGGGVALASDTIVALPTNMYDRNNGTYDTNQGEVVPFTATGTHNVTATQTGPDGKPLFRSLTISGGSTPVSGTQYLTAGSYTFFCTIHPETMQATLHVSGNGTPVPRPQGSVKLNTKTISKALKRGLQVAINMSAKTDGVNLTAKLGKTVVARANALALAAGQQFAMMKLNKAGRNKLRGKSKATLKLNADIPFGPPATAKAKLK